MEICVATAPLGSVRITGAGSGTIFEDSAMATVAVGPRERGTPSTVIPGFPGARVWVPMTISKAESVVKTELPEMIVQGGICDWRIGIVKVPMMSAVPVGARE